MTDWKPGDRFKLECEGEVGMGAGNSTEGHTRWAKIDGLSPNGVVVSERWLDTHATKIQRSLKFGDWVEVINPVSTAVGRTGVIVQAQAAIGTGADVWLKGNNSETWFGNSELRLIEVEDL